MILAQATPGAVALQQNGLLSPVLVEGASGQAPTQAMWDTGSTISSVDRGLLQQVGAQAVGSVQVGTVSGTTTVPVYSARILTPGGYALTDGSTGVLGDNLPAPTQVLLGREVMAQGTLSVNGGGGRWSFATPAAGGGGVAGVSPWLIAAGAVASIAGMGLVLWGSVEREEERVAARRGRKAA